MGYPLLWYAMNYHYECEIYDRLVCARMKDGVAIPTTPSEAGFVGRNAIRKTREWQRAAREDGLRFTPKDWMGALHEAARYTHEGMKHYLGEDSPRKDGSE